MVEIIWSDKAKRKLKEILDYFKDYSLDTAISFKNGVKKRLENLKEFPQIGRIIPEINDPEYREIIFKRYRILYKHLENQNMIIILTLLHSRGLLESNGFFD